MERTTKLYIVMLNAHTAKDEMAFEDSLTKAGALWKKTQAIGGTLGFGPKFLIDKMIEEGKKIKAAIEGAVG